MNPPSLFWNIALTISMQSFRLLPQLPLLRGTTPLCSSGTHPQDDHCMYFVLTVSPAQKMPIITASQVCVIVLIGACTVLLCTVFKAYCCTQWPLHVLIRKVVSYQLLHCFSCGIWCVQYYTWYVGQAFLISHHLLRAGPPKNFSLFEVTSTTATFSFQELLYINSTAYTSFTIHYTVSCDTELYSLETGRMVEIINGSTAALSEVKQVEVVGLRPFYNYTCHLFKHVLQLSLTTVHPQAIQLVTGEDGKCILGSYVM